VLRTAKEVDIFMPSTGGETGFYLPIEVDIYECLAMLGKVY
jgi:hypothetical protein